MNMKLYLDNHIMHSYIINFTFAIHILRLFLLKTLIFKVKNLNLFETKSFVKCFDISLC